MCCAFRSATSLRMEIDAMLPQNLLLKLCACIFIVQGKVFVRNGFITDLLRGAVLLPHMLLYIQTLPPVL